jgi:hypothetical protein
MSNSNSNTQSQSSKEHTSKEKKNEPPKTPDIKFTKTFHRTNDSED